MKMEGFHNVVTNQSKGEGLWKLFSIPGEVMEVSMASQIRPDSRFTYALVRYKSSSAVQHACDMFDEVKMENSILAVITARERGCASYYGLSFYISSYVNECYYI